jgi:hypothetical protein
MRSRKPHAMRGVQKRRSRCGRDKKALFCSKIEVILSSKQCKGAGTGWMQVGNIQGGTVDTT